VTTARAAASTIPGTFTPHGARDLTIALPALLGGGTLLANLAGTVQFGINPATITSTNAVPLALAGMTASAAPFGNPGGMFSAVDTAGAGVLLGPAHIVSYAVPGIASAGLGYIDPVAGRFGLNWDAVANFDIFAAGTTTKVGAGEILLFSPETGPFNPATGVATSATLQPVPATLLLRPIGGATAVVGITINNYNKINADRSAAGAIGAAFGTNSVPDLTIGLPDLLGNGTLYARLAGTLQFATPSIIVAPPVLAAGSAQLDFSVNLLPASPFQLLKSSHANGPWVQDARAVLSTNVPGSAYRFTTAASGTPAQFYRISGR